MNLLVTPPHPPCDDAMKNVRDPHFVCASNCWQAARPAIERNGSTEESVNEKAAAALEGHCGRGEGGGQ